MPVNPFPLTISLIHSNPCRLEFRTWRMGMKELVIGIRKREADSLLKHLSLPPFNQRRENRFPLKKMIRRVQSCNPRMQLVQSLAQRRRAQARRYLCLGDDFKEGGYL